MANFGVKLRPPNWVRNSAARQAKGQALLIGSEIAKAAGISRTTVYRWMDEGVVPRLPFRKGVMAIAPVTTPEAHGWLKWKVIPNEKNCRKASFLRPKLQLQAADS